VILASNTSVDLDYEAGAVKSRPDLRDRDAASFQPVPVIEGWVE